MKRRKVLTSASVLAGAALTGCGGGGEDGALGGDPSSQIAAYTLPASLLPSNGQWHVEVVFHTTSKVNVDISCGTSSGTRTLMASKVVTSGTSHRINFATLRCNSDSAYSGYTKAGLFVKEFWSTASGAGAADTFYGPGLTSSNFFKYTKHTDWDVPEHEWVCYSSRNGAHLCTVRFFKLQPDEVLQFNTGEYVRRVISTSTHANGGGLTRTFPLHHPTNLRMLDGESAVFVASDSRDTICIPNPRVIGHDELVPSYLCASDAEKAPLRRRLARHIDKFSIEVRKDYVVSTADHEEIVNMMGNELSRITGGTSLINYLNGLRQQAMESVDANFKQMGAAFGTFLDGALPALLNDDMVTQNRELLDSAIDRAYESKVAGGTSISTNIQGGFAVTGSNFPWPGFNFGAGCRISFGLTKAALKWAGGTQLTGSLYRVTNHEASGYKVGFTGIIKGFGTKSLKILDELGFAQYSGDIELTFACTFRDGVCRLDSVTFDPVFDIDTRSFIGRMFVRGMSRLLATTMGGLQAVDALPAIAQHSVPGYISGSNFVMESFFKKWAVSSATVLSANLRVLMKPMVEASMSNLSANVPGRVYGTLEASFLRVVVVNSDVNNTAQAFRGGFVYGGMGWQPGVKYIAGAGIEVNYSIGTVNAKGFVRVVSVLEGHCLFGPPNFIRSASSVWHS